MLESGGLALYYGNHLAQSNHILFEKLDVVLFLLPMMPVTQLVHNKTTSYWRGLTSELSSLVLAGVLSGSGLLLALLLYLRLS